MDEVLVIDIGGTKTNVSFVKSEDSKIEIVSSNILKTPSSPEQAIKEICSIYNSQNKRLSHISLSLPGFWDKNGVLKESYFLHDWLNYPFVNSLAKVLEVKNYSWETDVICGALGEYHVAGTVHNQSLLYINLGTGVGAALIKDGKPYKAGKSVAPTLRMQKLVFPFQDELFTGVDLISGGTLLQYAQYDSIETLYSDYKKGDVEAFDIISKAQIQLAAWLINLFYLFSPDLIVLNGGLVYDWEVLASDAIELVKEELEDQVEVLPSKLKEMAPIYGAYLNFCNVLKSRV